MMRNGCFLNVTKILLLFLLFESQTDAFNGYPTEVTTSATRGEPKKRIVQWKTNHSRPAENFVINKDVIPLGLPTARRQVLVQMRGWDGDDVRWTSRFRRKVFRRRLRFDTTIRSNTKTALILLQIILYAYQILSTIINVRRKFPSYWPNHSIEMIADSIWGSAVVNGPLTNTFGFSAAFAKSKIPYRYITSGFFHSGLLHLLINIGVMSQQPSWLATGLGGPLYLTTFFGSIIAGNIAHVMNSSDRLFDIAMFLGSSGGICGLFGLMFVSLTRIANVNPTNGGASSGQLLRGMAIMILLGLKMDNVNTAMNVGGFFGGIVIGVLCGPHYQKDYAMRRKNSAGFDPAHRDYRTVMGFGIMPTESGWISLKSLYAIILAITISKPEYRSIPLTIARGLRNAV